MKQTLLLASLFILGASAHAAAVDLTKLPPASDKKGLTYAKDIRPFFEASCLRCHGEERQRGGLRLDSLEAVLKGGEDGKILTPGDSKKSKIVIAVAQLDDEIAMPPKRGGGGGKGPGGFGGKGFGGKGPGDGGKNFGGQGGGGKGPEGGKNFGGKGPGGPGGPMSRPLTAEQVGLIRAWIDQGAK
ncbi:MAG: hypothetical protein HY300_20095 [Verrucomicrobia bacterium]|nr:hypothetical protein [Verrucomicrobiota bacterium]